MEAFPGNAVRIKASIIPSAAADRGVQSVHWGERVGFLLVAEMRVQVFGNQPGDDRCAKRQAISSCLAPGTATAQLRLQRTQCNSWLPFAGEVNHACPVPCTYSPLRVPDLYR